MPTIANRVVVDRNVLIGANLQPKGPSRSGIEAVTFSGGVILFSQATFDELLTRLNRPRFDAYISREIREIYIRQIEAVSEWVPITGARLGCRDPDGDKVLETALSGGGSRLPGYRKHGPACPVQVRRGTDLDPETIPGLVADESRMKDGFLVRIDPG